MSKYCKLGSVVLVALMILFSLLSCGDGKKEENGSISEPNYKAEGYGIFFVGENIYLEQDRNVNFKSYAYIPDTTNFLDITVCDSADNLENNERYGEEFFNDNILVIIGIEAGSGSHRYYVSSIYKSEERLAVGVSLVMTASDIDVTDDVQYRRIYLEIDRDALGEVSEFKAVMETRHRHYYTDLEGLHMQHTLSLDMNSGEFILCYFTDQDESLSGEKWYKTIKRYELRGRFELGDGILTLLPDGDSKNKLVFELNYGDCLYNSKKSKFNDELPFGDKTRFELN